VTTPPDIFRDMTLLRDASTAELSPDDDIAQGIAIDAVHQ
jgi:hypothetical protein